MTLCEIQEGYSLRIVSIVKSKRIFLFFKFCDLWQYFSSFLFFNVNLVFHQIDLLLTMNSIMAENTLYDIFSFLCKNDITLNNIITYGTQFNLNNVIFSTNSSHIYEEWDYIQRDNEAMKLIPKKYADHICIKSTPNGNCFFNRT
ncbi:hypothetical protein RclHR1_22560001 [Rhizophagus clarus]|uniref:Uncharacterized protein n=1 Tax=Rhizophagus clarus TaxID=94130 RepID=A0A2Z6R820_9GLOM|nr:hypothetical protein RclHR1_22560001 [Rhizophagus clarus]